MRYLLEKRKHHDFPRYLVIGKKVQIQIPFLYENLLYRGSDPETFRVGSNWEERERLWCIRLS